MKKIANLYVALRSHPHGISWKWRMIVFLVTSIALILVYEYLQAKYFTTEWLGPQPLSEKLYNWFLVGFLIGLFAAALTMEGEFILALRRAVRSMENDAQRIAKDASAGMFGGAHRAAKPAAKKKRR